MKKMNCDKMIEILKENLELHNARLIHFEYYPKIFGNIILKIIFKDQIHEFILDRDDIFHDNKLVHFYNNNTEDRFNLLLKAIDYELFGKEKRYINNQ